MFNKIQLIGRLAKENTFKSTANGIDIFQKFYYAVNDGRFCRAVDKVIEAHKKKKRK